MSDFNIIDFLTLLLVQGQLAHGRLLATIYTLGRLQPFLFTPFLNVKTVTYYMQTSMTVSRKYAHTLLIAFHHMFQIIRMEEVVTELIE